MGLAASQARLLSITARLSDNELHSQQISNSKVRLADRTQEASQEYIQALNATKLMYTTYDAAGGATQTELTPAIMYQYSDLKNQYGISNTSGQLLVNSTDAMNFEASANVNEFVQAYGVELTTNPQFLYDLEAIYGKDYADFYDVDGDKSNVTIKGGTLNWINKVNNNMTAGEFSSWAGQVNSMLPTNNGKEAGSYGEFVAKLKDVPDFPGEKPVMPAFDELAAAYNNSACYDDVNGNDSYGIRHMEHNLCKLIWGTGGFGFDEGKITNSDGSLTIVADMDNLYNDSLFHDFGGTGGSAATNLLNGLKSVDNYECVQEIIQSLIDLYCDVVNYFAQSGNYYAEAGFFGEIQGSKQVKQPPELYEQWKQFYEDLANLNSKGNDEYNEKLEEWESSWDDIRRWQAACTELYNQYIDDLANLPNSKIPDEEDPKTGWYVNLWHRMNGESDRKSTEGEKGTYYKQLDDNLLTSSSWLQFALEHGVVTLEKVQYVDEAEDETGLKTTKWVATAYSSCTDITETEDEVAIARAETEYNQKLRDIESKDKKFDNDLKKLDTEHNALQTEYESVKSVIEKNTERSFKAFS